MQIQIRSFRESATAAAKAGSIEAARRWADAQASGAAIGPGTATLGGINLGISLYEFGHAKNDKQRFFSGLSAGSSVYLLAGGPYGAAVGLAVTVVSLINTSLDANSAKELLEIYKRAEEYEKVYVETKTKLAHADSLALDEIIAHLRTDLASTNEAQLALKTQCADISKFSTLEQFDTCVFWITSFYAHAGNVIFEADRLLGWDSEFISNDRLFELSGINRNDLKKLRDAYAAVAALSEQSRKEFTTSYVSLFTDIIVRRALDTPKFSTEEYLAYNCQDTATTLVHEADLILAGLVARKAPYSSLEKEAVMVRTRFVLRSLEQFDQSSCREFATHGETPEKLLLREWLAHLANTESLLEARFVSLQ